MQYARPCYPQRVKDELLHSPAHAGRTGRQSTTPEAWTRTNSVRGSGVFTRVNPFHGSVTHSTWTDRALPGGGRLTGQFSSLWSKFSIPERQKDWLQSRGRRSETSEPFRDYFGFYAGTIRNMRFGPLYCHGFFDVQDTAEVCTPSPRRIYGIGSFITYRQQGDDDLQPAGKRKCRQTPVRGRHSRDSVGKISGEDLAEKGKRGHQRCASCPRNPHTSFLALAPPGGQRPSRRLRFESSSATF